MKILMRIICIVVICIVSMPLYFVLCPEEPELYDMIVNDELQELEIRDGINGKSPAVEINAFW